tara:strand:- start:1333 stop:3903 length:2571 start_codon:yes stop_codon:yes gene_type:complete
MADIITVYNTEANALAGGSTGLIVDSTVGTSEGIVQNASGDGTGTDNDDIPYFIYNRYYYRIDANEPVSEFQIDWDDGENNSPEKRNIQIIKLETPQTFCVVEHVYTKAGVFYPLIRVKSMDGFLSKWYTSDNGGNAFTELEPETISAGQNEFSRVSKTKADSGQIATFAPSITPPVAILKTDKKRIFSGIDNKHITGTYPLLYCLSSMSSGTQPIVKLTVQGATGVVREYTVPATSIATANTELDDNTGNDSDMHDKYVPFGNAIISSSVTKTDSAAKLLRAELLNMTKLGNDDRIYIKVHDVATGLDSLADIDGDRAVCVLSNGNPIVDLTDTMHTVTVDGSESFSRASNSSLANYYLDTDSLMKTTIQAQSSLVGSTKVGNSADALNASNWQLSADGSVKQSTLSYTNDNLGHYLDGDGRFYDFYRLLRLQVADNHTAAESLSAAGEIDNRLSFIEHYDDDQYTSTVASGSSRIPLNMASRGLILYSNSDTAISTEMSGGAWKDLTVKSRTNAIMIGSDAASGLFVVSSGGGDSTTYKMQEGSLTAGASNAPDSTQRPDNYILLCKTDKYDRVYFRTDSSFASTDADHTLKLMAWYATSGGWEPLEITDKTLGLKTSGYITFNKPKDWAKVAYNGIEGGNWTGPVHDDDDSSGSAAPRDLWDFAAYGILIGLMPYQVGGVGDPDKIHIHNIWPFSNEHSQLIKVMDPHHVSLNDIAIAQSISFNRTGKFQNITDRFGKSEIRKMGVNGGAVKFGSVDLGDTDAQGNRKKIKQYQQDATPVFLDVTHKSGEKTRFFGVITSVSEDHPVGNQFPKYGVQMQVSHVIEMESDGDILSDKISIGGNIDDKRQFVSTA